MSAPLLQRQALEYLHQGHYAQAASLFQDWADRDPAQRAARWYLGLVALLQGDRGGLERYWWSLITQSNPSQDPEITHELHRDLIRILEQETVAFMRVSQPGVAKLLCQQIIELAPHYLPAYLNLGQLLGWMEHYPEALDVLQKALELAPDHPEVYYELAMIHKRMGQPLRASIRLKHALKLQPNHTASLALLDSIWANECAWHFPMMNDRGRNLAYQQAIERAVRPGDRVLDIGAGAGLLSLMAARAGAEQVSACEGVAPVAEKTIEVVAANGLADRIRVIGKHSTDLTIPQDLDQPVDLILSETFAADLVSEGAIGALTHGLRNLAKPGARVIPQEARLYCALFEGEEIWQRLAVSQVCGFDLRPFNEFSWPFRLFTQMDRCVYRLLSEATEMAQIVFSTTPFAPIERAISLTLSHPGLCHGIVCWFDLLLDDQTVLTSGPRDQPSTFRARHWGQMIQLVDPPVPRQRDQEMTFRFECQERVLSIRYLGETNLSSGR